MDRRHDQTGPIPLDGPPAQSSDPAVARVLQMIHVRSAERLDVASLAREAGLSRSVLAERFGKAMGQPPMRYCARWRLRQAAIMLRDCDRKAGDVAFEIGFGSEEAFSRAFKRLYGQSPAAWRRQVRSDAPAASLPIQQVRYC